jgi:NADP-dependent 3-hydroxy acid dehydrogenase YdfG
MSVLITGASSGIGEACAVAFAQAHYDLVLMARREDRLEKLKSRLSTQFGVSVYAFGLDVRNQRALDEWMKKHPQVFDSVDILVNNAGLARGLSPLQQGVTEDWDAMIDTNIKGLLYVTRAILPKLISKGRGHVINLGSIAGHWVYEKGNVYCASKFAVRALTQGMRMDLQGTGIRVTEISPGMVKTEFSEVRYGNQEQARAVYEGRKPLLPEDIAETVLWCVQRPEHVNIQEVVIYPTEQASVHTTRR